jgi:orotate phosphoribosyltransferase
VGGEHVTDAEVLQVFRDTRALFDGHFVLRSGLHSRQYFQCAMVLQHPRVAEQLCGDLAAKLKNAGAQVVISPALGGLFVGHEVARALDVRHIFVEKNSAGKLELRRGFQIARGERVLVVEDVVTKGGRVRETLDIVRALGGKVVGVGSLVDRSGGKVDFGIPLESLLRLSVDTFDPTTCPLCQAGTPVLKPGS